MKVLLSGKQRKKSQLGFTLAEVVIAIAVSAILLVGSVELVSHMVIASAQNRAKTMSMLQVQYVGFWITEDVVQARPDGVSFGTAANLDGAQIGLEYPLNIYPLNIDWEEWGGVAHHIQYSLAPDPKDSSIWILTRTTASTPADPGGDGAAIVGEYLVPDETVYEKVAGNGTAVLKLDVTANVDGKVATRTYEINPRSK